MQVPEVRYARSAGDVDIAYCCFGRDDGPRVVLVPGFVSHLDLNAEFVPFAAIWDALAERCRVLAFDKRGTGLSSRDLGIGSLAERAEDVRAVMDAAGWDRAHLVGISEGGPMAALVAAQHAERVESLTLHGTAARFSPAPGYPDPLPAGFDPELWLAHIERRWGSGTIYGAPFFAHSELAPPGFLARFERNACTPKGAAEVMRRNLEIDVREFLPLVHAPTLVTHAVGDPLIPVELGRYLASHIEGARLVEVPGAFHGTWKVEEYEPVFAALAQFITGERPVVPAERFLATVLFTDIVGSTERAAAMGDRAWRALLDRHDDTGTRLVANHGGRVVKQTGDGLLATFDGPARAVRCAHELVEALAAAGVAIRAGLHTGEIERRSDDVGGIGVHIGARVAALAGGGEVLVSRTVRDLTVGSDLRFEDRGEHALKGVPEPWRVFAAVA